MIPPCHSGFRGISWPETETRGFTSGIRNNISFTDYLFAWVNLNQPQSRPRCCNLIFAVNKISINKSGSAVLLAGSGGVCVIYLFGRASAIEDTVSCRVVSVGSEIYSSGDSVIHLLQASWHPDSDTHLGILSSDAVFRLSNFPSDAELPEQEYHLQPVETGRSRTASSIYPADFSFGGDHLWDRFTVFILFTDGSVYILCPVVPFESVYKWESIMEIYNDANMFGVKSSNSIAASHSSLAIDWLEAVFPELTEQGTRGENILVLKSSSLCFARRIIGYTECSRIWIPPILHKSTSGRTNVLRHGHHSTI